MASGGGIARARLAEERKSWRRSHPHGFVAKPATLPDGMEPSITVRQILGIQDLLDNPNPASPAQRSCYELLVENLPEYKNRVRQQAKKYPLHV
ncbi:SUMO-conjugating enzyme Ubc9 [Panicum miliaceum]|uniref:SUMO-conjugating enzyme Ubc9 n=1 Tax=Panicum miliaceum TaxID=4540 RepID=A0A3L6QA43_PANMI|nr:SUMO-conjugating enzyme Ubc9 [Panicum miliaceum]